METLKEYYYTYYSYEEYGRGYIGSRKCKCLPEKDIKYFGSFKDKSFKPTQKIILKSDYATREEAYADEIILQRYYKVAENSHFANRAYQTSTKFSYITPKEEARKNGLKNKENGIGLFSISKDEMIENSRKIGLKHKENGTGIFSLTTEERQEIGRRSGEKNYKNKVGIHAFTTEERRKLGARTGQENYRLKRGWFALTKEERIELGRKTGKKTYELGLGVHGRSKEQMTENGKIGGKMGGQKSYELKVGIHGRTKEQMREQGIQNCKKTNSQKWMCIETGYISTSSGVVSYQKGKRIDTSKSNRIRLS